MAKLSSDDFVTENTVTPNIEVGGTLVIDSSLFHKGGEPDALEALYSNDFYKSGY